MSVYKPKGKPFYHYDFRLKGVRFFGSTGQTTERAAKRVEAKEREAAALGRQKPTITIDEAFGRYWDHVAQRQPSAPTTFYQLGNLKDALGAKALISDIGMAQLQDYRARRRADVSDSSVNREIQLYRRVWKFLAKLRSYDMGDEPDWSALLYREPKERVRSLSAEEEARLFDALRPDLRPFATFAIATGARLKSVIRLRWSDVDLQSGTATLAVKGGGRHSIPLTPGMVALIADQPRVGPYVFTYVCQRSRGRRRKGQRYPLSESGWRRAWAAALAEADVVDFRFHDLRHTAATRLLRHTGNLKQVQRLLGHTDIATTARYAHVTDHDLRAALTDLESLPIPDRAKAPSGKTLKNR